LRLQSGTKAAIDQKRFVGAARIGLLKSCYINWGGGRVERRYLRRIGCGIRGIRSIRDIRIARETSRRPGPTASAAASKSSAISRCTAAAEIPTTASAPTAAEPATTKATSAGVCSKRADLQREINFSGIRCDLDFALLWRETEHSHLDSPCAWSHIGEFEIARGIGKCSKDAISLSGTNGSARQRLACRFY
jgi:hypothetical protein